MQVKNKFVSFVHLLPLYRDVSRKRGTVLFFLFVLSCLMTTFVMLKTNTTTQQIRKVELVISEKPRLVAHKLKDDTIDGFYKNGTTARNHVEILVKPWSVIASESRSSSFTDKNIAEIWSSITLIKSSLLNKKRRNSIRQTWAKFKFIDGVRLETVFILGTTDNKELQDEISKENKKYGDILQVDLPDTKENVPLKLLAGMQWASDNFPEDWLYSSADDDFVIHLPNFIRYIEKERRDNGLKNQNLKIMCIYGYRPAEKPERTKSSPWYVPLDQYPATYWPPYCRGGWYTMPMKTASNLYNISRTTPFLYLDDVWVTGIMRAIMNNKRDRMLPYDTPLSEEGITFAPLADRTDKELYYNSLEDDLNKVIVSHTWSGEYGWFSHKIENDIRNVWNKWGSSVSKRMKYFVTFTDVE